MLAQKIPIPCISIRARRVSIFARPDNTGRRHHKRNPYNVPSTEEKLKRSAFRMRRRIYDAVAILRDTAREKTAYNEKWKSHFKFYLSFVTLTLPFKQVTEDREIHYKLFRPFMRRLKAKLPGLLYIWRAETQQNGNLHYHLITNSFIHHRDLKYLWNEYCYKYDSGMYQIANSTDIHSLRNVNDEASYIAKYITKTEAGRRKVEMKLWGCSEEINGVKPIVIEMPNNILYNEIRVVCNNGAKKNVFDYCTVINVKAVQLEGTQILKELFQKFYSQVERK